MTAPADVVGYTRKAAGEVLAAYAQGTPADLAILEIGVFQGRSLLYLAQGSADGRRAPVHGVDPWNLPGHRQPYAWVKEKPARARFTTDATWAAVQANVAASGHADLITLHRAFSADLAASWIGPKIGLAHIDGDHSADGVRTDITAWAKHFACSAILCFDDYVPNCQPVIDVTDEMADQGVISRPYLVPGCNRIAVSRYLGPPR